MSPNTLMSGPDDVHMRYTKFYMIMFSFVRTRKHQRTEWSFRLLAGLGSRGSWGSKGCI